MGKIISQCPSCKSAKVHVAKMECASCDTRFEGKFEIPALLRLSDSDLDFILQFVKCSGSLKEMAKKQNVSYPTLRNRLNDLIEAIEQCEMQAQHSRSEVLKLLEEGKISAKDAAIMLQNW